MKKGSIRVIGNNNCLRIEEGCNIGPNCTFFMVGDNTIIHIGKGTTFTREIEINAQESHARISIGDDCMLSNHIIVRTSDSHPIFDNNGIRINPPKNVVIGNHVWIAPNTKIMKGAVIGDGAIIGSDTTITKFVPNNTLCVGRPMRIAKENVHWARELM